ncbi:MAG TPA: glycosyltransferase [Blastocatellia bacterium]|nr:glycosyltransferase [Blastocatellia bacterium]
MNQDRIGVMHLTDTLDAGGLERVAVNIANVLPRQRYESHLCTTRRDGSLSHFVNKDVRRLRLNRTGRFDVMAIRKLIAYINDHQIRILHAHGSSLFIARIATLLCQNVHIIWHDHYGRYLEQERPVWLYKSATTGIGGVIAVNESLACWSRNKLRLASDKVWYVPNFVCPEIQATEAVKLPGTSGSRIVCVANLRPQKDHLNLLRAMQIVKRNMPQAHLLLIGNGSDQSHIARIKSEIKALNLESDISMLGERQDVQAILNSCDIGVISSASEGLPLALIEYGMAGLPVVATNVGQCAEVLDNGQAGILVPPNTPDSLADAILSLLINRERAIELGENLRKRTEAKYSVNAVINRITEIYETVLNPSLIQASHLKDQFDLAN